MSQHTYVKPADYDDSILIDEVNAAVTVSVDRIRDTLDGNITIVLDPDLPAPEQAALDGAVASHPTLASYKERAAKTLSAQVRPFIYSRYDQETQASLNAMWTSAINGGAKPNRAAHIKQVDDWREAMMVRLYAQKDAIAVAADEAAVDAIAVDWDAEFGDTGTNTQDPKVTIESATAITT